jgi:gingipain R
MLNLLALVFSTRVILIFIYLKKTGSMKKILLVLAGSCFTTLFAQSVIMQNSQGGKFTVLSGDEYSSVIEFRTGDVISKEVTTQNGTAYTISTKNGTPILESGFPDLPKMNASIVVPDEENMQIQVVESQYTDYLNIEVAPSKGTLVRTVDPALVPFTFNDVYNNDIFYPFDLAYLGHPYIQRDFRAQTITVNPIQYNATTKTLRVYTYLKLSVTSSGMNGENQFVRNPNVTTIDNEYHKLYNNRFINYENTSRYSSVSDNGSMLIISDPAFEASMQPFVNWKIQRGTKTVMVNTAATGMTTDAIKTYIQNYYTAHPELKYVLFVGDDAQVPTAQPGVNSIAGPSDNFYGYLAGNDHYPELFIGRFSATTISHVSTMVQRSIEYEKNPLIDASFGKSIHIGSDQGPGDDGQYDFEHQRALFSELLNFTYTAGAELYDGTQGGEDAAGNPDALDAVDAINAGAGIITYTGHGYDQGLGTTGFSNTQVPSLTNAGKLPFFWSVACVNGNFSAGTCFAEALTRSTDGSGNPTGSVATLMSTINQYWNEPMEGQDEMVHLLTLNDVSYNKKTFGAISMNGCMQMNDAYGTSGMDMTDTWTCFGDPSLMVRTATPQNLVANHSGSNVPGTTTVYVSSAVEGAFVAVTMNNMILGTGTISGGAVNVTIPAAMEGDVMTVTVTAFNYVPHIGTVTISAASAGIDQNSLPGVSIYPNPATEFISINAVNGISVDAITIYDMLGKVVYNNKNSVSGQYNISVEGWAKGTYHVQLTSNGKTNTSKVILK